MPPTISSVSTRRVDELIQAMGITGISKLRKSIDERVQVLRRLDRIFLS